MAQQKMQKVNKMPNPIGNLYTAGAVQFNTQPLVNLSMQLAARRQAKEDAFNQYLQTAASRLTPAGMRMQEFDEFKDKRDNWQKFVMQNKGKLASSPELQMQANTMLQDALATAERSKQLANNEKPVLDKMLDKKWTQDVNMDKFNKTMYDFHQPSNIKDQNGNWVPNPAFKNLDYRDIVFNPPPLDINKVWTSSVNGMEQKDTPGKVLPETAQNGKINQEYVKGFADEQLPQIGRNAANSVLADPNGLFEGYRAKFENLTPEEHKRLNDIYQSVYGDKGQQYVQPDGKIVTKDIVDSPEKLAAAEMIERAIKSRSVYQKSVDDYNKRLEDKRINISINQSGSKKNDTPTIDLTEYENVPNKGKDITPLMGGIKVTAIGPKGDTFRAEKVYYDPATKRVTLKEYDKKDETTMTLQSFLQNIKTSNPGTDIKFLEGLANVSEPPPSNVIHINDIPAGVKLEQKGGKYYYKGKLVKTD